MNWISEVSKFIQQTAKTWLGLFLASGVLLFFPQLISMGDLSREADAYFRIGVRFVFLLSSCFLVSDLVFYVRDFIRDWRRKNARFEVLKRLAPPEREVLRHYLKAETKSLPMDSTHPTVIGLMSRKILIQPMAYVGVYAADSSPPLPTIVLESWAYDYLQDHPELIS